MSRLIYVKLSEINGVASFDSLCPMLSEPVALIRSIFRRYFSAFSQKISGTEKQVSVGMFSLQKCCSLSKSEVSIGSLILDATVTKKGQIAEKN